MNNELKHLLGNKIFTDILNNLSEYVYIVDESGYLQYINHAALNFEKLSLGEVIGKHINDIYQQKTSPTLKALETGNAVDIQENIYIINENEFRQSCKSIPLLAGRTLIGVCTIQNDYTHFSQMLTDNIKLQQEVQTGKYGNPHTFDTLLGEAPAFKRCIQIAKAASKSDASVLLSGPTGSGKEMFAKSIHHESSRSHRQFLAVNCAAIPEGLLESILFGTERGAFTGSLNKSGIFEQANGGTLFLDEINSMPLHSQAKLLRVLEERALRRLGGNKDISTDVRIISSINASPMDAVSNGQLRADLFYRLSVITIEIPPLAGRSEDIILLANHYIDKFNKIFHKNAVKISEKAMNFITTYHWPGNVRQIKHIIESAINILPKEENTIELHHFPSYIFNENVKYIQYTDTERGLPSKDITVLHKDTENIFETIRTSEKQAIIDAQLASGGNITQAAKILNISRQTLTYRMKKYKIKK